jgi:aspartate racemase
LQAWDRAQQRRLLISLLPNAIQYGAKLDEEFPHMMIYSLPAAFYIDNPIDHKKIKLVVKTALIRFETAGFRFVAIPHNTAHA